MQRNSFRFYVAKDKNMSHLPGLYKCFFIRVRLKAEDVKVILILLWKTEDRRRSGRWRGLCCLSSVIRRTAAIPLSAGAAGWFCIAKCGFAAQKVDFYFLPFPPYICVSRASI
jgi:hypothetical protein